MVCFLLIKTFLHAKYSILFKIIILKQKKRRLKNLWYFRGISTRTLAVAWWFFVLIIVTMYVANLAAALTSKSIVWEFKTAEELAYQTKIKYGAKINGSTFLFFQVSERNKDSYNEIYRLGYIAY